MRVSEKNTNVGLGLPSVFLIAVVLAMVTFALLALRSAQAEKKLADKTGESVGDYYAMESRAEELIARLEETVVSGGTTAEKLEKLRVDNRVEEAEYTSDEGIYVVRFKIASDKKEDMGIYAKVIFSEKGGYDIGEWKMVKEEHEKGYDIILPD